MAPCSSITITARVKNIGQVPGDEVVQAYISIANDAYPHPQIHLVGFKRVKNLAVGEARLVAFHITPRQMTVVDDNAQMLLLPGPIEISIGGGFPLSLSALSTYVLASRAPLLLLFPLLIFSLCRGVRELETYIY